MVDWHRRKRVRNMRRVLRQHGSPASRGGCLIACLSWLGWLRP